MEINIPSVVAEVTAAFNRYEKALNTNDVGTLDDLFWNSPHTLRYGVGEQLYGYDKRLFPYTQLDDGLDNEPAPRGRTAPGEGLVPLDDILDALTPDLPLSLEWGGARDGSHTSYTWAVQALADARKYLDGYYERKAAKK